MLKPGILVTGATGKTGRLVVAELLKAGYPVRAMVHREDGRSAQFVIAPLSPDFDLDRYDRELRRPFPSEPQFASDSKVWRCEHAMTHAERGTVITELRTLRA
jgi:nucleoside-diphosphate-sugar epimerase